MAYIGPKLMALVMMKTNGRCFYCNRPAEVVDHFMPKAVYRSFGGFMGDPNSVENLVPACRNCNSRKSASFPEDFMGGDPKRCWNRYDRANLRISIPIPSFV